MTSNTPDKNDTLEMQVKKAFCEAFGAKYLTYVATKMVDGQLCIFAGLKTKQAMEEFNLTFFEFTAADGTSHRIPIEKKYVGVATLHVAQPQP